MDKERFNHIYKVVLIGNSGVGKTHLLNRYVRKSEPPRQISTIGVEFATIQIPLKSGEIIKAQLWDTAGQEKYRAITSAHYRRAVGALICYDITNQKTFESCKKWLEEVRENSDENIVLALIGNKLDLVIKNPQQRKVDKEQAQQFAQEEDLFFKEVSAFSENQVENAFQDFFEQIYEIKNTLLQEEEEALEQEEKQQQQQQDLEDNQGSITNRSGQKIKLDSKNVQSKKQTKQEDDSNCCN